MRKSLLLVVLIVAGSLAAACTPGGGSSLTGKTWFLTSGSQTSPAWQWAVPPADSLKHTITFNDDKTFSAKADCNQVSGTYETSGANGLTITPGPSTMAFCGEGSLGSLYTTALGTTESYKVDGNTLTLTLKGGGTMSFASVQPSGSAAPPASPPEVSPGAVSGQGLTGKEWQLTAMTEKVPAFQGVVPEAEQANYTITFADDKTFSAKADCNNVAGAYDTDDPAASAGRLTITPGPTTLVACGEGSFGDLFVIGLSKAFSYSIENDALTIVTRDLGTLTFK